MLVFWRFSYTLKDENMDEHKYDNAVWETLEKAESMKFEGDFQEAIHLLEQLILEEPDCSEAYEELGDNYLSLKEIDKAEKAICYALKLTPDSSNAHYLWGFMHSLSANWMQSVDALCEADRLLPNHPEILRCLGWAFYNTNRVSQGISVLERSRNLNPMDPNTLCDLGVCYLNTMRLDDAQSCFDSALKLDPESEQAQECLRMLQFVRRQPKIV